MAKQIDVTPPPTSNRGLLIALVAIGGLIALGVVALIFMNIGKGLADDPGADAPSPSTSATPSVEPNASATPTETGAEPEEPAVDTSTRFTSFNAPTETECDAGDEDGQLPKPPILVSWSSANAVEAWYSPSDEDAKDDGYMQIPLSGNQDDLTDEHLFPCFHEPSHPYTITLVGPNGEHVSRTWVVTNVGDQ